VELLYTLVSIAGALTLQGVALFFFFRKKIADANRAVAEARAAAAEAERKLAETQKLVTERDKLIAETRILDVGREKARLEVAVAQFTIQDSLETESKRYRSAQHKFADLIEALVASVQQRDNCTSARNAAIRCLTEEVIDAFSAYVDKARGFYRTEPAAIAEAFIEGEVVPFLLEIDDAQDTLNDPSVLSVCPGAPVPLKLGIASLASVRRCVLTLQDALTLDGRERIARTLQAVSLREVAGLLVTSTPK